MLGTLFLWFSKRIGEEAMFPVMPIAEVMIFVGIVLYAYNVFKNLK